MVRMKFISALLVLSVCSLGHAGDDQSHISGCANSGKIARKTMEARQSEVPLSTALQALSSLEPDAQGVFAQFIRAAYAVPIGDGAKAKAEIIDAFEIAVIERCFEALAPKN